MSKKQEAKISITLANRKSRDFDLSFLNFSLAFFIVSINSKLEYIKLLEIHKHSCNCLSLNPALDNSKASLITASFILYFLGFINWLYSLIIVSLIDCLILLVFVSLAVWSELFI